MKYEKPEMKVLSFAQEDILTQSGVNQELTEMVNGKKGANLGSTEVNMLKL